MEPEQARNGSKHKVELDKASLQAFYALRSICSGRGLQICSGYGRIARPAESFPIPT